VELAQSVTLPYSVFDRLTELRVPENDQGRLAGFVYHREQSWVPLLLFLVFLRWHFSASFDHAFLAPSQLLGNLFLGLSLALLGGVLAAESFRDSVLSA
jgi:hypothetical protein